MGENSTLDLWYCGSSTWQHSLKLTDDPGEYPWKYSSLRTALRKILKFHLIYWCGSSESDFPEILQKLCIFAQNFHTRKLSEISVFCAMQMLRYLLLDSVYKKTTTIPWLVVNPYFSSYIAWSANRIKLINHARMISNMNLIHSLNVFDDHFDHEFLWGEIGVPKCSCW